VAAEIAQPLTDTKALSARATMLMDRSDYNHAAADLKAILASQPRNAQALASLGLDYALGGQDALATANLDTAFAIDPKNALIFTARGLVALHQARYQAAITAFTTALTLQPESIYARQKRAFAYHYLHDDTNALADSAAVIAQSPDAVELYVLRANIFLKQGSPEKAVQEAAHLVTANPDNSDALASAGAIYARLHKTTEAALVFDRAIAIEPTETVYLTRAQYRPHADFVGRRADIMAALSLAPQSFDGLEMLLKLQMDQQAYGDAMATIDTMIRIEGRQTGLLTARATVLIKLAKLDQAAQEFAAARAMAAKAGEFNTLCWAQATAGVNLAAALRDCDRGLAQAPQAAAILDSRGFVLLRLQRYDEAIAAYQAALKVEPKLAGSLYGKAIAERRRGNVRASEADLAAAKAINQDVVQEFAGYGVTQ
jgi:tetratricopeptide (TPR) repeat protein